MRRQGSGEAPGEAAKREPEAQVGHGQRPGRLGRGARGLARQTTEQMLDDLVAEIPQAQTAPTMPPPRQTTDQMIDEVLGELDDGDLPGDGPRTLL